MSRPAARSTHANVGTTQYMRRSAAPTVVTSGGAYLVGRAATGITSFADRTKIAARIAEPSAARHRCAFKHG
jgi:hypothetical protein